MAELSSTNLYDHADEFRAEFQEYIRETLLQKDAITTQATIAYNSSVSSVNFVHFIADQAGQAYVAKANLWGRSMLVPIEATHDLGLTPTESVRFALEEETRRGNLGSAAMEVEQQGLRMLNEAGLPTPSCKQFGNILLTNRVGDLNVETFFTQPDSRQSIEYITKKILYGFWNLANYTSYDSLPKTGVSYTSGGFRTVDSNFNDSSFFPTSEVLAQQIQSYATSLPDKYQAVLKHGDLKPNNLVIGPGEEVYFIDPKPSTGHPVMDLGKFTVRSLLFIPTDISRPLTNDICEGFADMFSTKKASIEKLAIFYGLLELGQLVQAPDRKNVDVLGVEMPTIYRSRQGISAMLDQLKHNDAGILRIDNFLENISDGIDK